MSDRNHDEMNRGPLSRDTRAGRSRRLVLVFVRAGAAAGRERGGDGLPAVPVLLFAAADPRARAAAATARAAPDRPTTARVRTATAARPHGTRR